MELNIKQSKEMDKNWKLFENNIIRISKKLREKHSLELYKTIKLEAKNKPNIELSILPTYPNEDDGNSAYVTSDNYNNLLLNKTELKPVDQLLIGCDPELFLIQKSTKKLIYAADYFNNSAQNNQVGNDGLLLELRPSPNINSMRVVDTLKVLLNRARSILNTNKNIRKKYNPNDIQLLGGSSMGAYTAGFHVHFGIPSNLLHPKVFGIRKTINQMVNILDYYVGIPSIAPEPVSDVGRRTSIGVHYGKPGDFRAEFPTLEYRVPGGFLLTDPILTKGLMGMSWVVMDDILARLRVCTNEFSNFDNIQCASQTQILYPHVITKTQEIYNVICNPTPKNAMNHIDTIFRDIEDMVSFDKEKKAIINFYNKIVSNNNKTHNIDENWGLSYEPGEMEFCTRSEQVSVKCTGC